MTNTERFLSYYRANPMESRTLESPTCRLFEPNMQKVFDFAQAGSATIRSASGLIVAQLAHSDVYGLRYWLNRKSNRYSGAVLIKNPYNDATRAKEVGRKNALVVIGEEYAFAAKVEGIIDIRRPVLPEFQTEFISLFLAVVNTLSQKTG